MSGILVYALHHDGAFNKNSLGAVSEGARLASELGTECHAVVLGDPAGLPEELCASLGRYGAARVFRVEGPEGLAQPVVDAMAKVMDDGVALRAELRRQPRALRDGAERVLVERAVVVQRVDEDAAHEMSFLSSSQATICSTVSLVSSSSMILPASLAGGAEKSLQWARALA